jgi:hypothetical protein
MKRVSLCGYGALFMAKFCVFYMQKERVESRIKILVKDELAGVWNGEVKGSN